MDVWIRNIRDFSSLGRFPALKWELPLGDVSLSLSGSVTAAGELEDFTGHWALAEGALFFVSKSAVKSGQTVLTLSPPELAFSRTLAYAGDGEETYGEFISAVLQSEWIEQPDSFYALPYLSVSNLDTTAFAFPVAAGELYAFADVLRAASARGVRLSFATAHNALSISVRPPASVVHNAFDGDGHTQVKSCTVTNLAAAKATVRRMRTEIADGVSVRTLLEQGDFYYWPDGSIRPVAPLPRLAGAWAMVEVEESKTLSEGAQEAFSANDAGYKIEFYTDRAFALGDAVRLRYKGRVYFGQVSARTRSSSDRRTLCRLGSLPVTLTEQLASLSK